MNFAAPVEYPALLGALVVLNWPVYRELWAVAFQSTPEAEESVRYFFVRSYLRSVLRGDWWKHLEKGSKAALLFMTIAVILCVEYAAIASIINLFTMS
jgi:hypothetical protein